MPNSEPLGLYIHWPFCARICPYCDFNVYKNGDVDAIRWANALTRDMTHWAQQAPDRKLTSIYFGGGTPSLAPVSVIRSVITKADDLWGLSSDAEITIEANPTDAEQSLFKAFSDAGVNRLSLGVQSLKDDALKFLGRDHSAADAKRAIDAALSTFPQTTFDLIYARPEQSAEEWRIELEEALATGIRHLSLYQLTIEPGTAFHKQVSAGRWSPLSEDASATHYEIAQVLTAAAGLPAYEISNHAAPGHESQHNLIYWRYQDYVGIGPGAHGRLATETNKLATQTHLRPSAYLEAVENSGTGIIEIEELGDEAQLTERLSMGLRLTEGIRVYADDPFYSDDQRSNRLRDLIADGFIEDNCGHIRLTETGRPLLNRILYELLA